MPLTAIKFSKKETKFLREILSSYIEETNHFYQDGPDRQKNTRARILHNAFFDLENNNVTSIELLK
tara:strand:+ start:1222 stop:1419 length:198 start_codon:yes stop_codon:yes gene_type:complete